MNEINKDFIHKGLNGERAGNIGFRNESNRLQFTFRYLSLTHAEDGPEYAKENFVPSRVERFKLILVTKMPAIPRDWGERFYCLKIVTPSM